jgi:hypothetical protein
MFEEAENNADTYFLIKTTTTKYDNSKKGEQRIWRTVD